MLQSLVTSMPLFVCGLLSLQLALNLGLRRFDTAQAWLLAWAVTATLLYGCHYVYFHHVPALIPYTNTLYTLCNLLVYPLFLVYISELTERSPLSRRPWPLAAVFLPGLLLASVVGCLYALMTGDERAHFIDYYLYGNHLDTLSGTALCQGVAHQVCKVMFAVEVVIVMLLSTRHIKRYNQLVEQLYSDTEDKTLHMLSNLLWLVILCSLLSIAANAVGRNYFTHSLWLLSVPSVLFSLVLFSLGWVALNQQFSIRDIAPEPAVAVESPAHDMLDDLHRRLLQLMEREKPFLQPDLKLDDLALMLHTNRTYLLRVMRQKQQMSFSEYINRRRIDYARRLMDEHPELSKHDVAARAGYSHPSSFYRNWKMYAC